MRSGCGCWGGGIAEGELRRLGFWALAAHGYACIFATFVRLNRGWRRGDAFAIDQALRGLYAMTSTVLVMAMLTPAFLLGASLPVVLVVFALSVVLSFAVDKLHRRVLVDEKVGLNYLNHPERFHPTDRFIIACFAWGIELLWLALVGGLAWLVAPSW